LLSLATGKSREEIISHPEMELSASWMENFEKFVDRRANHEPFSHISGEKEFMGLPFIVTPDTLIPRPETEQIVEESIKIIKDIADKKMLIADIGTGSGCIAISVTTLLQKNNLLHPAISVVACDFSHLALTVCKQNIQKHLLTGKISTFEGDLLAPITENNLLESKQVLIIVANLPYLSEEIYLSSPKTVRKFEPKSALFSKEAGLSHYKKMLEQLLKIKKNNPALRIFAFLEISPEQKESLAVFVNELFSKENTKLEFFLDLSGKWRLVKIEIF
jgi:release factor glutamine methyltransferase